MPQAPQCAGLVNVSTHCPSQTVSPAPHAHPPLVQLSPAAQALPQLPQLALLLLRSTQLVPHATSPAAHPAAQVPSEQS